MANFCPDTCFCETLNADLAPSDTSIPGLALDLNVDEFTYLSLSNGINCEHVKATQTANGLTLVRGQGGTNAQLWPKGTTLAFTWSKIAITEMIQCVQEEVPEDTPKIEGYTPEIIDGVLCYVQDNDEDSEEGYSDVTVQGKDCIYTFKAKSVKTDKIPAAQQLMPGTYENATVTVDTNGCIVNIKTGCKPTIQGCAKCDTCEETGPTPVMGVACQASPPTDGRMFWVNTMDGCMYVLCDNTWLSTGQRLQHGNN